MKRFLAISLIGAGLFSHNPGDAIAQASQASKDVIWLSCSNKIDGRDINYIFNIDFKQQGVAQYDNRWVTFYEMHDVGISEDTIRFSYFTKGSHPLSPDEELFRMVDTKDLNNRFEAHVTTDIEINRRSLLMRSVKRYYDTILSTCEATCSVIDAMTLPSRQF